MSCDKPFSVPNWHFSLASLLCWIHKPVLTLAKYFWDKEIWKLERQQLNCLLHICSINSSKSISMIHWYLPIQIYDEMTMEAEDSFNKPFGPRESLYIELFPFSWFESYWCYIKWQKILYIWSMIRMSSLEVRICIMHYICILYNANNHWIYIQNIYFPKNRESSTRSQL